MSDEDSTNGRKDDVLDCVVLSFDESCNNMLAWARSMIAVNRATSLLSLSMILSFIQSFIMVPRTTNPEKF